MADPYVIQLYHDVKSCMGRSSSWAKVEYSFFEAVSDVAGDSPEGVKERLGRAARFLVEDSDPGSNQDVCRVLGVGQTPAGVDPRQGEGRLLSTRRGIEVRSADMEWTKEDGVYVSPPHKDHGCTIFHPDFVSQLDRGLVREALQGQQLYVSGSMAEDAEWLIDEFQLEAGERFNPAGWRQFMRRGCSKGLSVNLAGVVLLLAVKDRPGNVGNLAKALKCCALENFRRQGQELLPLPLPIFTKEEETLLAEVKGRILNESLFEETQVEALLKRCSAIGVKVWTWLTVFVVNYMYCQGSGNRMLTDCMLHGREPNKDQQLAIDRFTKLCKKWTAESLDDEVLADTWEQVSQSLGDIYTGPNIGKSYPLTLKAILPTTPGKGEAARVDLSSVVSPEVKPFVEDASLLRLSNDEVTNPRVSATVQVTDQEEWNKVVSHLVQAGMLEREVESETIRYQDVPIRNGAFGVHKAWILEEDGSWFRTLRLIINMIPGNSFQRRMPLRSSERMGYAPLWGQLYLHDDEILMCCAEDQKHCFHIYRPGYSWRAFFSINRKADGSSFGDGKKESAYPRVCSAPMGWNNVVDFIQDGFENLARNAGLAPAKMIKMGEPSPLEQLATPRNFYSFYVDNFDELLMVWRTDQGVCEGRPSDSQLKLREEMRRLEVGRDPKKAAEGSLTWASLGAEVDGDLGWIGSSTKFRKALLGANLGLLGGELVRTDSPNLQSVVSKNMHSVQYCRGLASLFDEIYVEMNLKIPRVLGEKARDELLLLSCALPLHQMDLRMKVSGQVYATDASTEGGGACVSTQLSPWGNARLHSLSHERDGIEGAATEKTVLVEAFAGIGGFKQALELLGYEPMGVIAIDVAADCAKVYKQHCRHVVWISDITKITEKEVYQWRERFPKATTILLTGGWPCINHSQLNAHRGGADAASSKLLDSLMEVRGWLKAAPRKTGTAEWKMIQLYENVVMDDRDYAAQTKKIGFEAVYLEAGQVGRCRRPRLYWLEGLELIPGDDLRVRSKKALRDHSYQVREVKIDTERPPLDWFLNSGAKKMEDPEELFPTFTRPIPRQQPPTEPAGLNECSQKARKRWQGDAYRLQPYWYENRHMVVDSNGPRQLSPEEKLRMMGFSSSHLTTKTRLSADIRGQMIGNAVSAIAVARLLTGLVLRPDQAKGKDITLCLWEVWRQKEELVKAEDRPWKVRFASVAAGVPGVVSLVNQVVPTPITPLRAWLDPQGWLTDEEALAYLLARNGTHRGGEIRIDLGMPYGVGELCRQSINPVHWVWKVLMSYTWKQKGQHINVLELVAVLDLLRKQARSSKFHNQRMVTLVDNQVALSCLAKGRSSARALQSPLRRINAVCLAAHIRLCLGWIKSKWNPADGPSRWAERRKSKKDA